MAAQNSPDTSVLAGPVERLEQIADELRADDIRVTMLKTSHAFHSPMMDGALEAFGAVVDEVQRHAPQIPIISTCTGKLLTDEEARSTRYWVEQIRKPVRFSDAVESLQAHAQDQGIAMLELGPGRTLASLFSRQSHAQHFATPSLGLLEDDAYMASWLAFGALWCAGYPLPVGDWWDAEQHHRVRLPTYPFRRESHWLEPVSAPTPRALAGGRRGRHGAGRTGHQGADNDAVYGPDRLRSDRIRCRETPIGAGPGLPAAYPGRGCPAAGVRGCSNDQGPAAEPRHHRQDFGPDREPGA